MANMYLYPPILDSSMPVFDKTGSCNIYYALSKFNSADEIKSIQISIIYQKSGINAVKKISDNNKNRYRDTGIIIINEVPTPVIGKTNLYSININPDDINGSWIDGEIYKVQLRFSTISYYYKEEETQEEWLSNNAHYFSEWSTICAIKPIEKIRIQIPIFGFDNSGNNDSVNEHTELILYSNTLDFHGTYFTKTQNENLYSYQVQLYDENDILIEDSKILYVNKYYNSNQFKYLFNTELEPGKKYKLYFNYESEHGFKESFNDFEFLVSRSIGDEIPFRIYSLDNAPKEIFAEGEKLSIYEEEEEGRIGLKLFTPNDVIYNGNICVRRTDNRSNFSKWEDIKIINIIQDTINSQKIFYDYTIESGIWYKYCIQEISKNAIGETIRGQMVSIWENPIIRNFEYSYLLGENGIQLKLKYNNDMTNFKINLSEGRMETIGSKYPFISRNGNTYYRTFPVNALITMNTDDAETFTTKKEVYNSDSQNVSSLMKDQIVRYYDDYNRKNSINPNYDYIYEHLFRNRVLQFLHDGKPKLFKSATEGNIIVRLMDINTSPTQGLGRMLYSFSATAYEMAESNLNNYEKYKFFNIGEVNMDFSVREIKLGQITGDFSFGENIFTKIWEKYDSQNKNIAGYSIKVESIKNLKIEINSDPFIIKNNANEYVIGNNINFGDINNHSSQITLYGKNKIYTFDSLLTFTKNSFISFEGFDKAYYINNNIPIPQDTSVNITIDFAYEFLRKPYVEKKIKSQTVSTGIGQYYEPTVANTSIYGLIYNKYYRNWELYFSKLSNLYSISIEANPKTVFLIRDINDNNSNEHIHEVGDTGILNLYNLTSIKEIKFLGIRDENGNIQNKKHIKIINENKEIEDIYEEISTDILVNYIYVLTKGEYIKDES